MYNCGRHGPHVACKLRRRQVAVTLGATSGTLGASRWGWSDADGAVTRFTTRVTDAEHLLVQHHCTGDVNGCGVFEYAY